MDQGDRRRGPFLPGGVGGAPSGGSLATLESRVILEATKEIGEPYAGPLSDHPSSSRFDGPAPHDGWDCSSFVAGMYARASGGTVKLTPYTDAIARETDPVPAGQERPGHIVLWRYTSPEQPNTRYPHVGLWLDARTVIDCRYPAGVARNPTLPHPREVRQVRR